MTLFLIIARDWQLVLRSFLWVLVVSVLVLAKPATAQELPGNFGINLSEDILAPELNESIVQWAAGLESQGVRIERLDYIDGCAMSPPRRNMVSYSITGPRTDRVASIEVHQVFVRPDGTLQVRFGEVLRSRRGEIPVPPTSLTHNFFLTGIIDARARERTSHVTMVIRDADGNLLDNAQTPTPFEPEALQAYFWPIDYEAPEFGFIEPETVTAIEAETTSGRPIWEWRARARNVSFDRIARGIFLPELGREVTVRSTTGVHLYGVGDTETEVVMSMHRHSEESLDPAERTFRVRSESNPEWPDQCRLIRYPSPSYGHRFNIILPRPGSRAEAPESGQSNNDQANDGIGQDAAQAPKQRAEGEWQKLICRCSTTQLSQTDVSLKACFSSAYEFGRKPATAGRACADAGLHLSRKINSDASCFPLRIDKKYGENCPVKGQVLFE